MKIMENQIQNRTMMCMQCGMCTGLCPEAGITPLNIRMLIRKKQLGYKIEEAPCWYCTSCGECLLRCPRDVKPMEFLIELKSSLVEQGKIPISIQKALENSLVQKNPWGRPKSKRNDWTDELDFQIPHISETESKRLLFSCCILAYDPRCMVIPINIAKVFRKAGLEFGVLGVEEVCCGNEIRRMGEAGLFEMLQEENTASFQKYGVKEIIALSPHCMNALKNEYGELGIKVSHYTEVLAAMIDQKSLVFNTPYNNRVIYHDPCFLGKQNKIFEEPRRILRAVEGVELLEFSASKENSLCCEGGGGRMFYEAENTYERNSERRTKEALTKGADILATSCPFCLMTLEDSATEKNLPVKELSEIIIEAL
jgi:Fe-S oxidoreductase